MGLDMYAYAVTDDNRTDELTITDKEKAECFFYWRKNRHLHGWMQELYEAKGGKDDFNLNEVELTSEDLDKLKRDINRGNLPDTTGFFFGNEHDYTDADADNDLKFIKQAKQKIAEGYHVYYDSWW